LPWNYHRVLTMRDNPLAGPEEWLDPKFARLDVSAHEWLRGRGLSEPAIRLAYGMNTTFGRSADDVSALLLLFRGAFSKTQRKLAPQDSLGFTARDGMQRIPDAMAAALRRGVLLGRVVTAIVADGTKLVVRSADGSRFAADHVVAAIPFGALRGVAIDPPLRGAQAEAVAELPAQPITQVYLRPKKAFWEDDGYAPSMFTDTLAGMFAAARNGENPREVTSFTAWVIGGAAESLEGLAPRDAGRKVIEAVERIRPAARGQLEFVDLKSWGGDPYASGAWAYFHPGQVTALAAAMGSPHGRLHFCGEHLARAARGMEAALESAESASRTVLAT
jgi:monoamine oxidase